MTLYNVLKNCKNITDFLSAGSKSIFKDQAPASAPLPLCVFTCTGKTPILHTDNKVLETIESYNIYIVTNDGADAGIEEVLFEALTNAGYLYQRTSRGMDYTVHVLTMGFNRYIYKGV